MMKRLVTPPKLRLKLLLTRLWFNCSSTSEFAEFTEFSWRPDALFTVERLAEFAAKRSDCSAESITLQRSFSQRFAEHLFFAEEFTEFDFLYFKIFKQIFEQNPNNPRLIS